MPIEKPELDAIVRGLSQPIKQALGDLERRIAALEQRPAGLKYVGTWDAETDYALNEGVTCGGSIWIARSPSRGLRPGEGPEWTLAVKRGRDGKDAR
jgi:hypothetical protein